MPQVSGFPYFEVQFKKDGKVDDGAQVGALAAFMARDETPADLLVVSHGWNNDMPEAQALYRQLLKRIRNVIDGGGAGEGIPGNFPVLGVLWPSKKFADRELMAGGAASLDSVASDEALEEDLEHLKGVFDDPQADEVIEEAKSLVPSLENSPKARRRFADLIRSLLNPDAADEEDASAEFFSRPAEELFDVLSRPVFPDAALAGPSPAAGGPQGGAAGGPQGGAAGLGGVFAGIKSGARNLLNFTTYYQMKERAGVVGRTGVAEVLARIQSGRPDVKLHLMGHSFGGRLVTAAADANRGAPVQTLTLLQAAFSHHVFAKNFLRSKDGMFRKVVSERRVRGPILATHTRNDIAVGKAYPIASLIAGQVAAALGDKNDLYGAIGRNGAQKTPEAIDGSLLATGAAYDFKAGSIHNLNADKFILNHSDISKDEVAYAFLTAAKGG